jgi:hypothetical protein
MSQISLLDEKTLRELETARLWDLRQDLRKVRTDHLWSGEGAFEVRDELDLLASMGTCPAVVRHARKAIAEIDRTWPHVAVA